MDLPTEVWTIVLSYLHLNDLIEMSATCKFFYHLLRENKIFIKKINNQIDCLIARDGFVIITTTCASVSPAD